MTARQQVYAIANGSGSAGKTSTALCLASLHGQHCPGDRPLLVDIDPQGNATTGAGAETTRAGISQALMAASANDPADFPDLAPAELLQTLRPQLDRLIQATEWAFDVLGSGTRAQLQHTVNSLTGHEQRRHLTTVLQALPYRTIILDCHGDLGAMTQAALEAADHVIAVSTPAPKEAKGIPELLAEVDRLRREGTSRAVVSALIPTMVRPRETVAANYLEAFEQTWPELLTPGIRHTTVVSQATFERAPVVDANPYHPVSDDFRAVYVHLVKKGLLTCPS